MAYEDYDISYTELNKRRRGDGVRSEADKLVNRMGRPKVKKIYLKRNGENIYEKPKLFVWRQWQSPKLEQLLEEAGPYVGLDDGAAAIFSLEGEQITDSDDIIDLGTYYISGEEALDLPEALINRRKSDPELNRTKERYTSLSAPEYFTSNSVRSSYPSNIAVPPTPPPQIHRSEWSTEFPIRNQSINYDEYDDLYNETNRQKKPAQIHRKFENSFDYFDEMPHSSDFDNEETIRKDKEALEKHKQKMRYQRRESTMIFNRRDQTHPDAYIIYVFLNGQGMECQYMNFQRKQLEKGMKYVLELIARRFSVNPAKLVDMDGKKISEVTQLMSRGSYVLIPVGQSFRDTWYFLPDNAIDTSSNKSMIEERSAQRDRLIQRRQKKEKLYQEIQRKSRSKSVNVPSQKIAFNGRQRTQAASVPARK